MGHLGDRERPGASGLRGLAERARALGGTLEFGVHGEHEKHGEHGEHGERGWRVTAVLPLD